MLFFNVLYSYYILHVSIFSFLYSIYNIFLTIFKLPLSFSILNLFVGYVRGSRYREV